MPAARLLALGDGGFGEGGFGEGGFGEGGFGEGGCSRMRSRGAWHATIPAGTERSGGPTCGTHPAR